MHVLTAFNIAAIGAGIQPSGSSTEGFEQIFDQQFDVQAPSRTLEIDLCTSPLQNLRQQIAGIQNELCDRYSTRHVALCQRVPVSY